VRFHHVNLAVPPDLIEAEIEFLVEVIGMRPVDPGPELADVAIWFELDGGAQVHLSRDPAFVPSEKAHVAVEVDEAVDAVEARLVGRGIEVGRARVLPTVVLCTDPSGNRWELRCT
jgi:catechol 2,3-dioxygenase-like lactoylglutathione lyase family enzyme